MYLNVAETSLIIPDVRSKQSFVFSDSFVLFFPRKRQRLKGDTLQSNILSEYRDEVVGGVVIVVHVSTLIKWYCPSIGIFFYQMLLQFAFSGAIELI